MLLVFLVFLVGIVAASAAPTGVPSTVQAVTFMVDSKDGDVDFGESIECVEYFMQEISEGRYKIELPHVGGETDGDTVSESHQLVVKAGKFLSGCTMMWTLSGYKEDLPFLILKNAQADKQGILSSLLGTLGLGRSGAEVRHPPEAEGRKHLANEDSSAETRHPPDE